MLYLHVLLLNNKLITGIVYHCLSLNISFEFSDRCNNQTESARIIIKCFVLLAERALIWQYYFDSEGVYIS